MRLTSDFVAAVSAARLNSRPDEPTLRVDLARAGGYRDLAAAACSDEAAVVDHDDRVGDRSAARAVDERPASDDERSIRGAGDRPIDGGRAENQECDGNSAN